MGFAMTFLASMIHVAAIAAAATNAPPIPPKEPYWLKSYPVAPYRESWNVQLSVEDLEHGMPKILDAVRNAGGELTQPLETFPSSKTDRSQQMSVSIPEGPARGLLKRLRTFGKTSEPQVHPIASPVPLDEVRAKIDRLMKERSGRSSVLAQVPASAEASEEVLEGLLRVEALRARAENTILLNLTVKGR